MGKLRTLFMSQVCMWRNSSFLPKRLSAFHANQAWELAAYDLALQQCEEDEISKQRHSAWPGSISGGKDRVLPAWVSVWLMTHALSKQRFSKLTVQRHKLFRLQYRSEGVRVHLLRFNLFPCLHVWSLEVVDLLLVWMATLTASTKNIISKITTIWYQWQNIGFVNYSNCGHYLRSWGCTWGCTWF